MAQGELKIDRFPAVCFAPALSEAKITDYEIVVANQRDNPPLHDAMTSLLKCVKEWWKLPESKRADGDRFKIRHKGKEQVLHFVPLEEDHQKKLFDLIPWDHELKAIQSLFDTIPADNKELRDCAFHLLWYVRELCLDREPLSQDKLPA